MGDAVDFIFGEQESTKGIRFQQEDNKRRQDFIEEQAGLARQDVNNIIPQGINALNQGYTAAIDAARKGPQAQIAELQRTGQRAQENILGGMNEYRRAIMGLPSEMDPSNYYNNRLGMKPIGAAQGNDNTPFARTDSPAFLSETAAPANLSGGGGAGSSQLNITPGQTTNAQIVEMLYGNGQISDYDYARISESFANSGSGSGTAWGQGRPASEMIGWLPDDLHPRFRGTNENIFNAIAANNPNTIQGGV